MNNLIKNYAKEGKDEDGKPNNTFYVDRAAAKKVSEDFVKKYLTLQAGENYDTYMRDTFDELFNHFDVL